MQAELVYDNESRDLHIRCGTGTILLGDDGQPLIWSHKEVTERGSRTCAIEAQRIIQTLNLMEELT